jgi:hypothetical protein
MNKAIILILVCIFISSSLHAQEESAISSHDYKKIMGVSWSISTPLNNLGFISKTSVTGGDLSYHFFVKPQIAIGVGINWSSAVQYKSRRTYDYENGAITTDRINSWYSIPITARGKYFLFTSPHLLPYAGLGVGALYHEDETYYSIFYDRLETWGFLATPEVGAIIIPKKEGSLGIQLGVQYNYGTNNAEDSFRNIQSLNVLAGLTFLR